MRTIFFHSDEMGRFDFGLDHPMKPERVMKTVDLCRRYGLMDHPWMRTVAPMQADLRLLTLFHDPAYIAILREASEGSEVRLEMLEHGIGTHDNPVIPGIFEWSLKAVGATCSAMEGLATGDAERAFNPYGGLHHAMPDHAEGFCYLNDIAIAIRAALCEGRRVAYVDCDA
ncbi:MAG: acetoin utilization protein AcuC, partial [Thermodesulfobacteriota bacterium]